MVTRLLFGLLAVLLSVTGVRAQEARRNAPFGLPVAAGSSERDSHLIVRPQYVLSYNPRTRTPNWVCWRLHQDDLGKALRGPFQPDPLLPRGLPHVSSHVYDGSGFDRGHMCPAQDRSRRQEDMDATFYLTNIVPQAPNCNQRCWERLESYCRDLAKQGHTLAIVCGPQGIGGVGKNGHRDQIGKGHLEVSVPARLWKVILVLPYNDATPRRNTRAIAVIMPNDHDQTADFDWTRYRVSVRTVEKLTGYTFFPEVPADVAAAIKGEVDDVRVRVPVPRHNRD